MGSTLSHDQVCQGSKVSFIGDALLLYNFDDIKKVSSVEQATLTIAIAYMKV